MVLRLRPLGVGAVTGSVLGPVGTAVGAAVGAVVGGLAGEAAAESANPTREDAYWRGQYSARPYVDRAKTFDDYGPAYGYGVNAHEQHPNRSFEEVETSLASGWSDIRGGSTLDWEQAKPATRDAFVRMRTAGATSNGSDVDGGGR